MRRPRKDKQEGGEEEEVELTEDLSGIGEEARMNNKHGVERDQEFDRF